jgi:APA family basic amino acid/polyamine antiporter
MIGSGVFLLPASLASFGGISIIGWLVSAGGALCLALVFAHLSRWLPKLGGPYAYARHGFGDFGGFWVAWSYWISMWTTNAALAVAFVSYLTPFLPVLDTAPAMGAVTAIGAIWLLTGVNMTGVRSAGMVQLISTCIKLLPLAAIGSLGLLYFDRNHFVPFNPSGGSPLGAITGTVTLTLWAFLGLESATVPAADVREPERTIPRATVLGTLIAATIYILSTVAVMGIVPPGELASSTAPFADAARAIWGPWAVYAIGAGAAVSCFGALNGWVLLSGQLPRAAALDGLLPKALARLGRNETPVVGLVVSSVIASVLITMNYTRGLVAAFTFFILLATLATLVPYVFSTMTELRMVLQRDRHLMPIRLAGRVALSVLAFIYAMWAIVGAGERTVYWGFVLLTLGLPVFVLMTWKRERPDREISATD